MKECIVLVSVPFLFSLLEFLYGRIYKKKSHCENEGISKSKVNQSPSVIRVSGFWMSVKQPSKSSNYIGKY